MYHAVAYPWIDHVVAGGWGTIALILILACFGAVVYAALRSH